MKYFFSFLFMVSASFMVSAQQTIKMRHLWHKPQVRVIFGNYSLYFTLKDMNKAMKLLPQSEKLIWGDSVGLDTNAIYMTDLEQSDMQYRNRLQPLIQNEIGAFLLIKGHAIITNRRNKTLSEINADFGPVRDKNGLPIVNVEIYDPKKKELLFSGIMWANFYHMDIDFD